MKNKIITYSRQSIDRSDIEAVTKVLKSNYLTSGPIVKKFESKVSSITKSKYAVSANSATSSLHLACLALGIKKNDLVWVPSISFVATANCAAYCGAKIEFLDIDLNTFNLNLLNLENKLQAAKKKKKIPKLLLVVHMAGTPLDMTKIKYLSLKYNFKVVEDASHALGSYYKKGEPVGNSKYSDISIFSFHPVKIATTCEGGISTTNSRYLYERMKLYREHGIERNKKLFKKKNNFPLYYEQFKLGYNYRLSEIHASLGLSQIKRVKKFVRVRNEIKKFYKKKLANLPIKFQSVLKNSLSSNHLIIILVPKNLRNKLFSYLKDNMIFTNIHYIPIFYHPFYSKKKYYRNNKNSVEYYDRALSLPGYYELKLEDQKKIINLLKNFFYKFNFNSK